MFDFLKRLAGKPPRPEPTDEEVERFGSAKEAALERLLGPMHDRVLHSVIPFVAGGLVDLYPFLEARDGTALATMELIEPDGTGPIPNRFGTFELVAFTKLAWSDSSDEQTPFDAFVDRISRLFTVLAHYSREAKLSPGE